MGGTDEGESELLTPPRFLAISMKSSFLAQKNVSNKDNRKLTLLFTDQVFISLKGILEGGARSRKIVGGARRCRIGSDGGHHQPEALWPVAVMAPKEAESEVLRKLSALTSLVICLLVIIENIM